MTKPTREDTLAAISRLEKTLAEWRIRPGESMNAFRDRTAARLLNESFTADPPTVHSTFLPADVHVVIEALTARMPRERLPGLEDVQDNPAHPFQVVVEKMGCGGCGRGQSLTLMYPGGICHHTSWEGPDALELAEYAAADLEFAYNLGVHAGRDEAKGKG